MCRWCPSLSSRAGRATFAAGESLTMERGRLKPTFFPTISDSGRVKMRHDTFLGMKSKRAFYPLFASIIGVLMKFSKMANTFSNPVGHPIFSLREKMPCRSAAKTGKNASAKFGPPLKFPLQTFDLTGEFPGRRRGERIPPVKSSRIEPLNRSGTPISRSACFQCKITPGRSGDRRSGSWGGNRWGRLGSKNSFNVRPHPGLLPPPSLRCGATSRGEGETFTASWNHPALDSRDGHSDNPRHTEAVPSPRGRGSG